MYNNSRKNVLEDVKVFPTKTEAGRVRSLHATKGWRESRIAPVSAYRTQNSAQKLYFIFHNFWKK